MTFIVDPLTLLKEKVEGLRDPVPLNSMAVTVEVRVRDMVELLTVTTHTRSFEVCELVPPKTMPLRTTLFVDPVQFSVRLRSSTRQFSPIVSMVKDEVTSARRTTVCKERPRIDTPFGSTIGEVIVYVPG
jgi:hypothetical protein